MPRSRAAPSRASRDCTPIEEDLGRPCRNRPPSTRRPVPIVDHDHRPSAGGPRPGGRVRPRRHRRGGRGATSLVRLRAAPLHPVRSLAKGKRHESGSPHRLGAADDLLGGGPIPGRRGAGLAPPEHAGAAGGGVDRAPRNFVEAADSRIDSLHSFMLIRHGQRGGRGVVVALRGGDSPRAVFA